MKYLELCAGLGGFSHAAEMVNTALDLEFYQCAAFSEIEPYCVEQLKLKWPDVPQLGTIHHVADAIIGNGIECDAVFGGIPCQPFSGAGKQMGAADGRDLWPTTLKIIRAIEPRWVCVENVSGFAGSDDGLPRVWDDLENEGFAVGSVEIPACAVGASHERMRCFVMAHRAAERLHRRPGLEPREVHDTALRGRPCDSDGTRGTLADAQNIGRDARAGLCGSEPRRNGRRFAGDGNGQAGEVMENAASGGSGRLSVLARRPGQSDADTHGASQSREALADAAQCGMEGNRAAGFEQPQSPRGETLPRCDGAGSAAANGRFESGVGGVFDELAAGVIRNQRQPALMGQMQHDWEPPRLAPKTKQWKAQLSALGNAIVPLQAFPVLLAMALSELESI